MFLNFSPPFEGGDARRAEGVQKESPSAVCGNHFAMPRSVSEEFGRSSRRREAFPKSSEGPRVVAKRFRRVLKLLAPSRSISEEFGRSSRRREAFPKSSEGPRAIAKTFRGVWKPFCGVAKTFRGVWKPFCGVAKTFRGVRKLFRGIAETFRRVRKPALSRIRPPDIRFAVFFRKFVEIY